MNELIIKSPAEVVVLDPFNADITHDSPQGVIDAAYAVVRPFRERYNALAAAGLENLSPSVLKELKAEADKYSKALMDWTKKANAAAVDVLGLTSIFTQFKGAGFRIDPLSMRGMLNDCISGIDAELKRREPPEETARYVIGFQATPSVKAKIIKAIEKLAEVEYCEKQKDEPAPTPNNNNN